MENHQAVIGYARHCKREAYEVYVGRPSAYGNPWSLDTDGSRETVVAKFRDWFSRNPDFIRFVRRTLEGKTLGCWCSPNACHADVLAEFANDESIRIEDPVFVFGSNLAGINGKGAALFAQQHRGGARGVGEGRQGNSYAIPTKNAQLKSLPLEAIADSASQFLEYARANPRTYFDVTRVGCGLAVFRDEQIAPLFFDAPANCRLPLQWLRLRDPKTPAHVIIAGSRTIEDEQFPESKVDALLAKLDVRPVIISGGARNVDQRGERYAIDRGLDFLRYPADWDRYGKSVAGMVRNQFMSWRASHVIGIWDGSSSGTAGMMKIGKTDGLAIRVLHITPKKKRRVCEFQAHGVDLDAVPRCLQLDKSATQSAIRHRAQRRLV